MKLTGLWKKYARGRRQCPCACVMAERRRSAHAGDDQNNGGTLSAKKTRDPQSSYYIDRCVKRGDFDGRGRWWFDKTNHINTEWVIKILPTVIYLSFHVYRTDTQLPMWCTVSMLFGEYNDSITSTCYSFVLIAVFNGIIHFYRHTVKHNHGQNQCN